MNPLTCFVLCVWLPLKSLQVTSAFGYRIHPLTGKYAFHNGVDLRAKHDTVFAIMSGLVFTAGYDREIGVHIVIRHGEYESIYGHLSSVFVTPRDSVLVGQPIGITGATGAVTGEHLHFAIRHGRQYINPLQFLYGLLIKEKHEQEF